MTADKKEQELENSKKGGIHFMTRVQRYTHLIDK
jgi:hypothetical protein